MYVRSENNNIVSCLNYATSMCVYTHTHTHTHTHIYIYIYIYTHTHTHTHFIFFPSNFVISLLLLTRHINNSLLMNCTGFIRGLPYVEYMRSAAHMHVFLIVSEKWLLGFTWNRFHNRLFCQQVDLSRLLWRPDASGAVSLRHRPTNPATYGLVQ